MTSMIYRLGAPSAALVLMLSAAAPGLAGAQTISGGSSGGLSGNGVSASTYGSGERTTTSDGSSIGVQGGGASTAVDGVASTDSRAKLNDKRAMQRSVARAQDDDERARSTTQTIVNPGGVRSRTTSFYREQGEKPVRETVITRTAPDGTTTTTTR